MIAAELIESSYLTPVWADAHNASTYGGIASNVTVGSVTKALLYANKIEQLRLAYHRKKNEKYFTAVTEKEGIEVFCIYLTSRTTLTTFPIFECPLHQAILRDCYVQFRLCEHNLDAFGKFLAENNNSLPPTGLPLSPPNGTLRNYMSDELRTFRNAHNF